MNNDININIVKEYTGENSCSIKCLSNSGEKLSGGNFTFINAHLNGALVKTMMVGGIGTSPENRRLGLVRNILAESSKLAAENNAVISVLHPFSFAYYRKFGYERVSDTRILEFPMSALNFTERYEKFINCKSGDYISDLDKIYNKCAENRNLMFVRNGNNNYRLNDPKKQTYISYDDSGEPDAYIIYDVENYFYVNKMVSVNLNVYELCFTNEKAVTKLFGFMRMFEGQLESVKIHECSMIPEIERRLRHYHHTKITVIPDIMARVNDVEAVLKASIYPVKKGEFTVKVYEPENTSHLSERTTGIWNVKYENKKAEVTKLSDDAEYDLMADVPAFTQLIFGYESSGYETAKYIYNTEFKNECEDFFRAFHNRPAGIFEHF